MKTLNVSIWTAQDNWEQGGEIGVSAVCSCETDRGNPLGTLELWAEKNISHSQYETTVERDIDVLRIHVGPHQEDLQFMEEPEEWLEENAASRYLRSMLSTFASEQGKEIKFEWAS